MDALTQEARDITARALTIPEEAKALRIVDVMTYVRAGEVLTAIKDLRKQIDAAFDPIIQKAHAAHKEAISQKKKAEAPLVEAEGIIKPQIAAYEAEQERIRRAEEARIRAELAKAEEEARLQAAIEAEAAGNKQEAEELLEEPVQVAPVVLPKATPKLEGVYTREDWDFVIEDESKIPRQFLQPNLVAIRGFVKSLKGNANIPGVKVFKKQIVSARGGSCNAAH